MKKSIVGSFAILAAIAALSACNSANNGSTPSFPNCTPPGQLVMIYPANGATGVPDSLSTVYVASSSSNLAQSQYQSVQVAPNGGLTQGGPFLQVSLKQIPKPQATPGFSNPIYYSTYIGAVSPASTWGVGFNNQNNANCQPILIGSFTTL